MLPERKAQIGDRLSPEVGAFEGGAFSLRSELDHLESAHDTGLPEATVLYCARILDAICAKAIAGVGLEPSPNLFSNLQWLELLNLMPRDTLYLADGLRRIGNDVRHLIRRVGPGDADVAVVFIEPCLDWFFRRFRFGHRLSRLFQDGGPLGLAVSVEMQRIIDAFTSTGFEDPLAMLSLAERDPRGFSSRTPVFAALLGELLLGCGNHAKALGVIEGALEQFPEDLRLRQLLCLWRRRTGKPEELDRAIEELQTLRQDDETVGILAATYKEKWNQQRSTDALERAHRLYRDAWKKSKEHATWLGINAATTALWLCRPAEARALASRVKARLEDNAAKLAQHTHDPHITLNYWDRVTRAESELLLGNLATARRIYVDAFAMYRERVGNISVSRGQVATLLPKLGLACSADEFFSASPGGGGRGLVVGVTGHRALPESGVLRRQVLAALDEVLRVSASDTDDGPPQIVVLSALAEGADRLVADVALAERGGRLRVVLPLEREDYLTDFETDSSRDEFKQLLTRADAVTVIARPPPAQGKSRRARIREEDPRASAYQAGSRHVVDGCDVLIALWNGILETGGPGGTADTVSYARAVGRPLVWINTATPFAITTERLEQLAAPNGPRTAQGADTMYRPQPIDTSHVAVPEDLLRLIEHLAENNHEVWARQRMEQGWTYGPERDDAGRRHPDLVPYADLPESEKVYDRVIAIETIKAIIALGYRLEK